MAGLLLSSGFMLSPAMAATITYNFTGTVTDVHAQLSSQFNMSQSMSGSMTVNTLDQNTGSSTIGAYSVQSLTVTIGTYTATMAPSGGNVTVRNLTSGSGDNLDRFLVSVDANGASVPPHSLSPDSFEVNLRGDKDVFSNSLSPLDKLPGASDLPPSISSFNTNNWSLVFAPGSGKAVSGMFTSLTAVPLPAAMVLFGVGIVALIGLGAGGLRNLRAPQA